MTNFSCRVPPSSPAWCRSAVKGSGVAALSRLVRYFSSRGSVSPPSPAGSGGISARPLSRWSAWRSGACAAGAPAPCRPPETGGERILAGCDALHHLLVIQLVQGRGTEFPPCARGGHRRPEPAAQRVRHDGGLGGVVLAPVHQHLARAQGLFHVADGEIRVVCLERAGQFAGEVGNPVRALGPVQGRVEVDALAAARHRHGVQANVLQDGAGQPGHLHALRQSRAFARVQVQHQPVGRHGVAVGVNPPLRHVDLQGRDLGQPGEGGGIIDQGVLDGPVLVRDGGTGHPAGG